MKVQFRETKLNWHLVLQIQRAITFVSPPLHSIRWKLLIFHLLVIVIPITYFAIHIIRAGGVHYSSAQEQEVVHAFIWRVLEELMLPAAIGACLAAAIAWCLSFYISSIILDLARRATRIAAGNGNVKLETWSKSELGDLARAIEIMRQKLEGKAYVEEMTNSLSHELKTPLAAIQGAAEILDDGAITDAVARAKFLGSIQREANRLNCIVNDLLQLSRVETHTEAKIEPIDVAKIARELASLYVQRSGDLGIQFKFDIANLPYLVVMPETQLVQVLTNLLDNAFQFTLSGKCVELVVAPGKIQVRDCGHGIDPDFLPRIFTRFFTTENPRTRQRGTGLGLAIVKAILDRHQGTVSVVSELGLGTTFTVIIPTILQLHQTS